jgi:hypothetical protein
MTGSKIKNTTRPISREGLEGFIWSATGWRGAPEVIDSILARVDEYTTARCREVADGPPARVDELQAEVVKIAAELNAARAEKGELLKQLEARPAVSTVERVAISGLLDLLTDAVLEATAARSDTDRSLAALGKLSDALRAADGKVKDITLSDRIAERRADPEFTERLADTMEQNAAALEQMAQTVQTVQLEIVTDGDAQTAKTLGAHVISTMHIDQAEADRLMEEEAAEVEQPWADLADAEAAQIQTDVEPEIRELPVSMGLGQGPGDLSQREGFGEPEPVTEPDEDEDSEMAAMIAEIEAEILATGHGAKCAKCGNIKVWENFYKDKQAANGHKGACKQCEAKHKRTRTAGAG